MGRPTADVSKTNTMTILRKLKRQPKDPNAYKTNQNDLARIARTQARATSCLQNKRNDSSNRWPGRPPHRESIRKQSKAALPRLRRRHPTPPNAYKTREKNSHSIGTHEPPHSRCFQNQHNDHSEKAQTSAEGPNCIQI